VHAHGRSFYLSRRHLWIVDATGQWQSRAADGAYAELRLREGVPWLFDQGSGWWRFDALTGAFVAARMVGLDIGDVGTSSEEPGEPWYLWDRQRLHRLQGGRWEPFLADAWPQLAADRLEALARLPNGDLAVGTRFGGYYQYSAEGTLRRRVAPEVLPGVRITDIEVVRDGALWLAIDGGLVRLEPDNALTRFGRAQGALQIERIARIDGALYLATRVGLKRLQPATEVGVPARFVDDRIVRNSTWDLLAAAPGGMLVGLGNGLAWLPPDPRAEAVIVHSGARVSALAAVSDGWIYAVNGTSLRRLRWHADAWQLDPVALELVPVFDARVDGDALWLSVDSGGAYRIDQLERWPAPRVQRYGAEAGLPAGRLTFGHDKTGLLIFAQGARRLQGDRLPLDPAFPAGLKPDVWVSSGQGSWWAGDQGGSLYRLARDAEGAYRIEAGPFDRLRPPARHFWRDEDQVLWTADEPGLARIASVPLAAKAPPAPVVAAVRTASGRLLRGAAAAGSLPLAAGEREIDILLAAPAWGDARPRQWQWREARGEWRVLPAPRLVYTATQAGRGELAFRIVFGREPPGPEATLSLAVAPLWHETLAARLAALVLLLATIVALAWAWAGWRTRRLEAQRLALEAMVTQRTAEVLRQAEEIRELSEARTRFFANVSHEFRTPLTLILGPLGDALAGRHGPLSAPLAAALDTARSSARRLLRMVGELLDLSRLSAGRFALHAAEHDLAAHLRRELEAYAQQARSSGISLRGEGLVDPLLLCYDADQMERMLANLLGNALKFTPAGGTIVLRLVPAREEVGIEVEDSGPGIAADEQQKVFERFYQGRAEAAPDAPGTGIGLALVRELAELHGGRVALVSAPGAGACFSIWLRRGHAHFSAAQLEPVLPDPPVEAPSPGPAAIPAAVAADEERTRASVLVVDDHAEVRRYLVDRLGDAYRVLAAGNGDEALARIAEDLPDVVVSDVMMPGIDGLKLAQALRSDPDTAGVPLLLLSAKAHKRDIVRGLEAGADDYLTKPFDTAELIARIEALLEMRRRLRREALASVSASLPAAPAVAPMATPAAADERFLTRLDAALEQAIADSDFGVAELAQAVHVDRATLFRRLKELRSITPSELIRERRLARARELLAGRRGTVSEVAYAVGQLRHDLEQVADQADVGDLEDRRFGVLVDRDDGAGVLDAGEVLDRAGDADRRCTARAR
jgi:signal transduction histidine kinase/DNA-binding response OmpR family regulator